MQRLLLTERSYRLYARGRRAEIAHTAKWLDALAEDVADLLALAFLDGCEFAGADLGEFDEERAAAARERREWASRMLREAARDWQGK